MASHNHHCTPPPKVLPPMYYDPRRPLLVMYNHGAPLPKLGMIATEAHQQPPPPWLSKRGRYSVLSHFLSIQPQWWHVLFPNTLFAGELAHNRPYHIRMLP